MSRQQFERAGDPHDLTFHINGEKHVVSDKFLPTTSLNDYLRDVAGLTGTKVMCKEAGCGCCAVTVTHANNPEKKAETMSINSCLCPLYCVDGWQVTTVEGIGSSKDKNGFHPIQERLAKHNGTQCGYCSPGFVMSMYGLLHQDSKLTEQEIEDSFDGHVCRCTGYRPILDAMKTFAVDSSSPKAKPADIEDLNKHLCPKTGEACITHAPAKGKTKTSNSNDQKTVIKSLDIELRESRWYRPVKLSELGKIMKFHERHAIKLIAGNTAAGIFKHEPQAEVYIDLRSVEEMNRYQETKTGVVFGAGTSLTQFKEKLKELQNREGFHYASRVIRHLKVLASVLVRNAGSIAGNLMIKYLHQDFPSDLFTVMEALGVKIEIYEAKCCKTHWYTLMDFLKKVDMRGKVVLAVELPKWKKNEFFRSYKITPRWQNAHAYINAGFKIPINERKMDGKPSIVLGGVNAETVHALKTEEYLKDKTLTDDVINEALKIMTGEIHPAGDDPCHAHPKYRRELAVNLLYKTLIEVYKPTKYNLQSGGDSMERPLSRGLQTYQEKKEDFPLREPMPKKTAPLQTSGEALYINDMPAFHHEIKAALVVSSEASATIDRVDPTAALRMPGVLKFMDCKDITGQNNFVMPHPFFMFPEELFSTGTVEYAGQPIGVILAESEHIAEDAARKVKVTYKDIKKPIIDLEDAIAQNTEFDKSKRVEKRVGDLAEGKKLAKKTVSGRIKMGTQYHYYIESQVAIAVPSEDGLDVFSATQWGDMTQRTVANIIGKPCNYVNVQTPRIGGGFGGKMFGANIVAGAVALGAEATGRPVRMSLDMAAAMKMIGKRFPIIADYEAGVDDKGKLTFVQIVINIDSGVRPSFMVVDLLPNLDQGYYCANWELDIRLMRTNKPTAGATRGPGSVPASIIIETIMEHLAKEMGQHPIMFKEINLYEKGQTDLEGIELKYCTMRDVWRRLKQTAEVTSRIEELNRFNSNNMWRKRGITMCAVKYAMSYIYSGQPTSVSIFAMDGTVSVSTSGVEMGQGLFTKVAQAVAHKLGIPIEKVKVRAGANNFLPNAWSTGGSTTSERAVASAVIAAEEINQKLAPFRVKMPEADWVSLVNAAYFSNVQLQNTNTQFHNNVNPHMYFTYMAGVTETEVDVLTGEFQVRRVDIMADYGESLNPTIDIGQTEGAFVMGLGAYLSEDLVYCKNSGDLLNCGTWEYKPPTTKDIPIDWRIHFLPDAPNPNGILSSKAVGEPPIGLASGALLAIKSAIENARQELTGNKDFIPVDAPYTVEKVQQSAAVQVEHLRVEAK